MALSDHEQALVRLMTSEDWPHYQKYLRNQFATAVANLRTRNLTKEDHGFFKGIAQNLEDQLNLPHKLAEKRDIQPEPDGPVNLDTPPD